MPYSGINNSPLPQKVHPAFPISKYFKTLEGVVIGNPKGNHPNPNYNPNRDDEFFAFKVYELPKPPQGLSNILMKVGIKPKPEAVHMATVRFNNPLTGTPLDRWVIEVQIEDYKRKFEEICQELKLLSESYKTGIDIAVKQLEPERLEESVSSQ